MRTVTHHILILLLYLSLVFCHNFLQILPSLLFLRLKVDTLNI